MNSTEPLFHGAPIWLTLPFAAIAAGVVFALLILFWGARLASRRRAAREEVEDYNEDYAEQAPSRPITPPVASAPPPLAEPPVAAPEPIAPPPPPPAPEPVVEAPAPVAEPEPVAEIVPTPLPPVVEEAPAPEPLAPEPLAPEPLADEPIAAAAALDASPAALASDIAAPVEPAPVPEPAPAPAPAAPAADDLTRMKGVGPRLADRLNTVGITSFAQLAALTPEEADALDAQLGDFQGRIHRDRWIEQASFLAKDDIAGFEGVFGKL
jgi:predicted flap endonuclease-1-like 5' DNA nuclease